MQNKKENPFVNLLANIILPVFIINKTALFPGEHKALLALGVALFFPISYGLWDLIQNKKTNYFSILGLVNTLITGLFAVFAFEGFWFAVKEAAMPAVLGVGVYLTSLKGSPFFKKFIEMSGLLKMSSIEEKAAELGTKKEVHLSFIKANNLFALSFFLSAVLNFALATYIFKPIDLDLSQTEKASILNGQISQMTWMGMAAIGLPMMVFLAATLFKLFKDLQKYTGLEQDEMLVQN